MLARAAVFRVVGGRSSPNAGLGVAVETVLGSGSEDLVAARPQMIRQCDMHGLPFGLRQTRPEGPCEALRSLRCGQTPPVSGNCRFTNRPKFGEARSCHRTSFPGLVPIARPALPAGFAVSGALGSSEQFQDTSCFQHARGQACRKIWCSSTQAISRSGRIRRFTAVRLGAFQVSARPLLQLYRGAGGDRPRIGGVTSENAG